jgi:chromosome segregation ATPase
MNYLVISASIIISAASAAGALVFGRRLGARASDDDIGAMLEESRVLDSKLVETLADVERLASKTQLTFLAEQSSKLRQAATEQKDQLSRIAERVDKTRADVQVRELEQQELRALKDDDETAIHHALNRYNEFSAESLSLEQKLAESLRTLDAMSSEIKMTPDQQAVFSELSNALTQASSQLRDVIIDYQNAHERLSNLSSRFGDLEKEYTKLVDQQLAGS